MKTKTLILMIGLLLSSAQVFATDVPDPTTVPEYTGDPIYVDGKSNYTPYEDADSLDVLKAVFLRRITNDPKRFGKSFVLYKKNNDPNSEWDLMGATKDPEFGGYTPNYGSTEGFTMGNFAPERNAWIKRNQKVIERHYPEGATLTTSNTDEIKSLFLNVANRIKLKLIN